MPTLNDLRQAQEAFRTVRHLHARSPEYQEAYQALQRVEEERMREVQRVFVPREGSMSHGLIHPQSGILGEEVRPDLVVLYYQGESDAVNVNTFADRISIAHSRLATTYPTVATHAAEPQEILEVASYDPLRGQVHVEPGQERILAQWLGAEQVPAEELLTTGGRGHQRREAEAYIEAHQPLDPMQREFLRQHYRDLGIDL